MTAPTSPRHPLLDILRGRNPVRAELAGRVIREAQRVLGYTLSTFPSGTDHTPTHTLTVEAIAAMLLPDAFVAELTDLELFFLVTACHYHDLAMAGTVADDTSAEAREQVRRDHAIRVGDRIAERWAELGFEDVRTARVLGAVCRGHRPKKNTDGEANWEELNAVEVLGPGTQVRVRLVSALVYAADELHLGSDRAPARIQNWREIRDEESRRHWRRHQAIHGPGRGPDGSLLFQVDAESPGFEADLRSQVFRKALSALRDLGRQARTDGVNVPLPAVRVQWDRGVTLLLLLPVVCADLQPRARGEIVHTLVSRLARETGGMATLVDLCSELGTGDDEVRAAAARVVGDAVTYRHLVPATDGFTLSTEETVADRLFGRMRTADELDRLFLGRYCPSWQERLFDSPYGRTYVARCVLPAVDRSFSVRLSQRPPADPLRVLLERCPTAARLVLDYRPPPSNLVKEVLLRQAVVAGALFDLHADPDRILDRELRAAVRRLTEADAATTATLRLIEELALVGGFSAADVSAAHELSDAARAALAGEETPATPGFHLTIRQSVPAGAPPATSYLPRLLLAGHRAEVQIMLAPAPDHALDIRRIVDGEGERPGEPLAMFGVGPGDTDRTGPVHLPARVEVSRESRTIRFYLGRYSGVGAAPYPTVIRLPPPPQATPVSVTVRVSIQWPNLTVRDLRVLDTARQVLGGGPARMEFLIEEGGALLATMTTEAPADFFDLRAWTPDVMRGLRGLDGTLPVPLLLDPEDVAAAGRMAPPDRQEWWNAVRLREAAGREECCPLYMRMANPDGVAVEESFLIILTRNPFSAPRVSPGGSVTQEDLDRQWNGGEADFRMTAYFEADVFEMARLLREWCRNTRSEFPFRFRFGPNDPPTPLVRSVLSVIFPRAVDRVWHRERPIVFEIRPVNRAEAYELEASYWRASGQSARAELADEIRARYLSANGRCDDRPAGDDPGVPAGGPADRNRV